MKYLHYRSEICRWLIIFQRVELITIDYEITGKTIVTAYYSRVVE